VRAGPARTWIAWETQRRSLGLAQRLDADLRLFLHKGWARFPRSLAGTAALLSRKRGELVFVQNPSMVLAAWAGALKGLFGYALVVDRHSNFGFLAGRGAGLKRRLSDLLSEYTLRRADLTIVTNTELAGYVERAGGRAFVLPDPFPDLSAWRGLAEASEAEPRALREILFVSSWAFDEPIEAAIEACRRLRGEAVIRITGRVPAGYARLLRTAPDNFVPTGFLSENDFLAAMAKCDAVMAVTRREATLVCGGYEGAAMGKPLILGNSRALREYFDAGAVYTDGGASDLEARIREVLAALPAYRSAIRAWHARREDEWRDRLSALEGALAGLAAPVFSPAALSPSAREAASAAFSVPVPSSAAESAQSAQAV
jgi:glycosyltransferase involved in cell wall biosynthesis